MSYRENTQSLATPVTQIIDGIVGLDAAVTARIESGAFTSEHITEICDLSRRLMSLRHELQQVKQGNW